VNILFFSLDKYQLPVKIDVIEIKILKKSLAF